MIFSNYKKILMILFLCGLIAGCRNPFEPEVTSITGIVKDSKGEPLSGAIMTISPEVASEITTDENGKYVFREIRCRSYTIKAKKGDQEKSIDITVESTTGISCYEPAKIEAPVIELGSLISDNTAPTVLPSTSPANNATGITVNSAITATFSEKMNSSTINTTTFTLSGVTGTVNYIDSTATFKPSGNLAYNSTYTATITTGVKDIAGNPLASDYVWKFTTGATMDSTAPIVSSTNPDNGDTEVAIITSSITATFNENMDASTITPATFKLSAGGNDISGTVTGSGSSFTFTPSLNLNYNTKYTGLITTGVKDISGNAMAEDYSWDFTTRTSDTLKFSGKGNKISDKFMLTSGEALFTITHDGSSIFKVELKKDGNPVETLVSTTGSYNEQKLINIPSTGNYRLDIEADGNWTITIKN
ncbi:MAG: Ig-like domain-containing protein [Candidatus Firestonebacteria bacterium]|nr:Ig-like domain-containing protein [Candidatus Firestonebacteria bacterium]